MLDFSSDILLENERVLLRPLQLNDLDALVPFSLNEPDLWQYSLVPADSADKLKEYINLTLAARNNKKEYAFIVFDKLQNAYAGSTRFYDIQLENKSTQLGYTWYGKKFQGTGLNKHCKFLMLQFAFEVLQMERVEFRADNNNTKSKNAMLSIGCKAEGILRQNVIKADGLNRRDSIILSILKHEWIHEVKDKLKAQLSSS